ncbi:hypothetical protein VE04_08668 [Pseudogymnoascus sp. 24MN13]|nr:hypothetical protein VE04_08668 [Pseudogymnoascus sp. 24MN13]
MTFCRVGALSDSRTSFSRSVIRLQRGSQIEALGLRHNQSTAHGQSPNNGSLLQGVKVLDLTRVLAGPFCTQILADYGADIIKVEHPIGGDDTRSWRTENEDDMWKSTSTGLSVYFATINRNKRSLSLNLKHEKGRNILFELAKRADVVVDNFVPGKMDELGIGYSQLKKINPRIIHASVSGYGGGGPSAKRAGYDVIAGAEAGLLHITGEPNGNPTKPGVGLTDMCTGLYLHGAILAALLGRQTSGVGQKIDASLFETQVSLLANVAMTWLNLGQEAKRWGTAHPSIVPYEAFKTRDRFLVIGAVNNRQFSKLGGLVGNAELVNDVRFVDNNARVRNRKDLKVILDDLFAKKSTDEWLAIFEGSGMPYGPINNMEQVFSHPQTQARDMIETVDYDAAISGKLKLLGIPVKFSEQKPTIRSVPPSLGEHTDEVLREIGIPSKTISELRNLGVV